MTCLCASCITTPSCIANAMQLVCTNCALGDKCIQTTIGCQMPADATSKGKQHALETKMKENSNFLSALGVMVVIKKGTSFVSAKDLTNLNPKRSKLTNYQISGMQISTKDRNVTTDIGAGDASGANANAGANSGADASANANDADGANEASGANGANGADGASGANGANDGANDVEGANKDTMLKMMMSLLDSQRETQKAMQKQIDLLLNKSPSESQLSKLTEAIAAVSVSNKKEKLSSVHLKTLPKLLNCENEVSLPDFIIWKKSVLEIFKKFEIDATLQVQLLRTACNLPTRLQLAVQQACSVEECFQIWARMLPPEACLLPRLISEIARHKRAYTEDEVSFTLDSMLKKIIFLKSFFPKNDISLYEAISAVSALQTIHFKNRIPDLTRAFEQGSKEGKRLIDMLQQFFDTEREHFHIIQTSLKLFKDNFNENNIDVMSHTAQTEVENHTHYAGGSPKRPNICCVCDKKAIHNFVNCPELKMYPNGIGYKNCHICLRPHKMCVKTKYGKKCCTIRKRDGTTHNLICNCGINTKLCSTH